LGGTRLTSVGVDGWGVDYALIGERGNLLENPYHYRDVRNEGMMDAVFERVGRDAIYSVTGIQFLQINTLFQFYAACRLTPTVVYAPHGLVTIPALLVPRSPRGPHPSPRIAEPGRGPGAGTRSRATRPPPAPDRGTRRGG